MEYGKIINQAWEIAWQNKHLWVFGFFAALGGGGNYGSLLDREHTSGTISGILRDWMFSHWGLLALLIVATVILLLVLMALHLVSRGGLIMSVSQICRCRPDNFETTLDYGLKHVWRILGIEIFYGLTALLLLVLTIMPLGAMIFWGGPGSKIIGVILLVLMALPVIALLYGLGLWANFSCQIAVLEDRQALEAISIARHFLRGNIGRVVLLGLIIMGMELLFGAVLAVGLVLVAVPFILLGMINFWLGLVPGILAGLPVLIVAIALYGTFASGYWTLAYLKLSSDEKINTANTGNIEYSAGQAC